MKAFEICEEENETPLGVLLYYEKEKAFIVELSEHLDEWSAPLLFASAVKKGIYTIPREITHIWVKERIIPTGRQNLGAILSTHHLKEYSEISFLELAKGRCSHDSLYLKKTDKLPAFVVKRMQKNLLDCVALQDAAILCIFVDGTIKKVNLSTLTDVDGTDKILKNEDLFLSCSVSPGGYAATFNNSIDIPAALLYSKGASVPLSYDDLKIFASHNLLDTQESCRLLDCTRQNLAQMIDKNQLHPVKNNVKGNLYLKGDVLRNTW